MNKVNGHAPEAAQFQATPIEAARYALAFMQRATMAPNERHVYAVAESFLQAIITAQVVVAPAPAPAIGTELEVPSARDSGA